MRGAASALAAPAIVAATLCAAILCAAILCAAVPSAAPATPRDAVVFAVGTRVVNPDLAPFAATVEHFGAGAELTPRGGGLEPLVFRTRFEAEADAADHVALDRDAATLYDTLAEGALDGAKVDVYRVTDGVFARVRRDRVAAGGFRASGWTPALKAGTMVPATDRRFILRFPSFARPDAPIWLAVRAVGRDGAVSPPSAAVETRIVHTSGEAPARSPDPVKKPKGDADGRAPGAPQGLSAALRADGGVELTWSAPAGGGVVGYEILRSDYPPERHRGYGLDLEGGAGAAPIRRGDMAIVGKTILTPSRNAQLASRVWGANRPGRLIHPGLVDFWPDEDPSKSWRFVPHGPDSPVEGGGGHYLEMTLGPRAEAALSGTNHAGADQEWYPVLEPRPYRAEVWLRADRPSRVRFVVDGPHGRGIRPVVFEVGTQWRRYAAEFTPPRMAGGSKPGRMRLEFLGEGRFDVDALRIRRADTAWLRFTPEDLERLASSGMASLRTHAFVRTGAESYDLAQLTNPGGAIAGAAAPNTLPQTLAAFEEAGVDPWLQIEPHFSPEEWLGLLEYLAAPFDPARDDPAAKPWAAKRHAQGRAAPWTDAFGRIRVEIGNETWNRLFSPWIYPRMTDAATGARLSSGTVYGLHQRFVADLWRASPYWTADLAERLDFVLGGWRAHPGYGFEAARAAPGAQFLTSAAYNGGWDEGEGPATSSPASLFNILNHVSQVAAPSARRMAREAREAARDRGAPLALGTYEAGPGYALNGLNRNRVSPEEAAAQERAMKSQAAGVATLDAFLTYAAAGFTLQNFFTFGEGEYWKSHAPMRRGGQAYPSWMLLSLFNREALGDMLETRTAHAPTAALEGARRREAVADAPLVAVYATRRDDRLAVVVLSRRVPGWPDRGDDGFTPARLTLPIASAESATLHRMVGPPEAHNVEREAVTIERIALDPPADPSDFPLDAAAGLDARGLPPGSALLYVFEGVAFDD